MREFNRREFFECHETLEALWKRDRSPTRYLYQGILLVGVGFYHLGRGNFVGAEKSLGRGLNCLRRVAPLCQGVDVGRLLAEAVVAAEALERLGPTRLDAFDARLIPTIHIEDGAADRQPPDAPPSA